MKIINRGDGADVDWAKFKYMVFDIPNEHCTYEERYSKLGTYCKKNQRLPKLMTTFCSSQAR